MNNANLIRDLRKVVGEKNVLDAEEILLTYSYDAKVKGVLPIAVVRPASTNEVSGVLALCYESRVPVIPRGAGTGTTGGAVPEGYAIVLEMVRMNEIYEIAPEEQLARIGPGVITKQLDRTAEEYGLMYAPDPASHETCTMGGNAATCAGGLRAVRYGVTKNHVLALVVVLADGRIIKTGIRTKKGVVGYDLTGLFVGSEGTLGVITELTVRLLPKPEFQKTIIASFEDLDDAGRCVIELLKKGIVPEVLELMDRQTLLAVRKADDQAPKIDGNILLIEVSGMREIAEVSAGLIEKICKHNKAKRVESAKDKTETDRLWDARRSISPALYKIRPHKIAEDVTVPIPKLVQLINKVSDIAESKKILWAAYGHAGDGNLHANLLVDPDNPEEMARVEKARKELLEVVVEMGGTISGEHGIGSAKRDFIGLELSPETIDVQRAIKKALDPRNILNPGKVLPEQ